MDNVKQQVADRLKQANNILVTVRTNPNIDLLAACIGLALVLDKLDKHATAVFSGEVPSAIEFLKPEETIEPTPSSLRDFIIALDKSKADKLRYKVEDKVVRIFITPYKTSITKDDLEFSEGDFNIDLVVALGVHDQAELDNAITQHGRILHDAAVISINNTPNGNLGSLNWQEISASSVSEMVADLATVLDKTVFDGQIATAILTGIVAETARFSNDKTTPKTMNIAAELMAAGANQQLVANELKGEMHDVPVDAEHAEVPPGTHDDGTLEISHPETEEEASEPEEKDAAKEPGVPTPMAEPKPEPEAQPPAEPTMPEPEISKREMLPLPEPDKAGGAATSDASFTGAYGDEPVAGSGQSYLIDQAAEAKAGAAEVPDTQPPATIELPPVAPLTPPPLLTHDQPVLPTPDLPVTPSASAPAPATPASMDSPATPPPNDDAAAQTLADIEASVGSSHAQEPPTGDAAKPPDGVTVDDARAQVLEALKQVPQPLKPVESLNAHPLGGPLHDAPASPPAAPAMDIEVDEHGNLKPAAPPSVPPPFMPPAGPA